VPFNPNQSTNFDFDPSSQHYTLTQTSGMDSISFCGHRGGVAA